MDVILDTNIFVQDFSMQTVNFGLLFDYLKKTDSRIIVPLIVYKEIEEKYRSKLAERKSAFERERTLLQSILTRLELPSIDFDISLEVENFMKYFRDKLRLRETEVIPYREGYLEQLVTLAIKRIRPFTEKGEEFRDALLWLSLLDIAQECKGESLTFISNDSVAFGPNHELHATLRQQANDIGKQINYYNSISKFIEGHATKIDYITQAWLFKSIQFGNFENLVTESLRQFIEEETKTQNYRKWGEAELEFTGYLSPSSSITEDNLTEYYVYEKTDGMLYVQANLYIEYEVEFIAGKKETSSNFYSWESSNPDFDGDYESKAVYKYLEAEIIFGIEIINTEIRNIELVSRYVNL